MMRKLALSLAAIGTLGLGALAMPAPAAADNIGFGFYFGTGGGHHGYYHAPRYRQGYHGHRHYRPHRHAGQVCDLRRVRTVTSRGYVVVRHVRDCYRAPRHYRW